MRFAVLAAVAVQLAGCGGRRAPVSEAGPAGGRLITSEMIDASGAKTAWDALRFTVPNFSFRETSAGTPARVVHRGKSSIILRNQPRFVLDGATLTDFKVLDQMSAQDIFSIEVLSGIQGTTFYGTGAADGVIILRTKIAL